MLGLIYTILYLCFGAFVEGVYNPHMDYPPFVWLSWPVFLLLILPFKLGVAFHHNYTEYKRRNR